SNTGDSIDLAAPGVNILGLALNGAYKGQTGTSGAAAHAAGAAGLLLSDNPVFTSGQLSQKLYDSSKDLGDAGRDAYYGWGRVEMEVKIKPAEEVPPSSTQEKINSEGNHEKDGGEEKQDNNNNYNNANSDDREQVLLHDLAITDIKIELPGAGTNGVEIKKTEDDIDKSNSTDDDKMAFSHLKGPGESTRTPAETVGNANQEVRTSQNSGDINNSSNNTPENFFHNISVTPDQTVNIIIHIRNLGQVEEKNIAIRLYINDVQIGADQILLDLKPEAIQTVSFPWMPNIASNENNKFIVRAEIQGISSDVTIKNNSFIRNLFARKDNGMIIIQYDVNPPVHQYLTEEALNHLGANNLNLEAYKEMKDYIPQLREGAGKEDDTTPDKNDPNNDTSWRPLRHFYRPTDQLGYFDGGNFNRSTNWALNQPDVPDDTRYRNSYQWATNQKVGADQADNHYSFQDAINEYKKGPEHRADAYQILGHILHLIEDASLPEHTQLESHYDGPLGLGGGEMGSGYEQFVGDQYGSPETVASENKLRQFLHPGSSASFYTSNDKKVFSYYNEVISKFTFLDQYFDSMASLSYYRNRFKGDLDKSEGERGQLEKMFPKLHLFGSKKPQWFLSFVGSYQREDQVNLQDTWWETKRMDGNTQEDPGWYYIENSYYMEDLPEVRPARYEADWYTYALNEMKKPRDQRFKTPYDGPYVENDPNNGKILAGVFADDLIPLAVQHAAGVMDLFWRETHKDTEPTEGLDAFFRRAAAEFGIPEDFLKAIGYVRSHWEMQTGAAGEYGVMQLNDAEIQKASGLINALPESIKNDRETNIRAEAALLRADKNRLYPTIAGLSDEQWFIVVRNNFSTPNDPLAHNYARAVADMVEKGVNKTLLAGESLSLNSRHLALSNPFLNIATDGADGSEGKPAVINTPASPHRYLDSHRTDEDIDTIVIHLMEGYYQSSIRLARDDQKYGAHYYVRSKDGEITQMVADEDIAWHAGDDATSKRSIGIEHEGFLNDKSWFTEAMYRSSAALVRSLAKQYNIPLVHPADDPASGPGIIGHIQVPGCPYSGGGKNCHVDPGAYWDWDHFMSLVRGDGETKPPPPLILPVIQSPDLVPVLDDDTFTLNETPTGSGYRYDARVTVKNNGNGAATHGQLCFDYVIAGIHACAATQGTIGYLAPGAVKIVDFSFSIPLIRLFDYPSKTIKIKGVSPNESKTDNNSGEIPQKAIDALGGVDLTSAALAGITIDPGGGGIRFVIKGDKAKAGDQMIDLNGARSD
ncbi:N-acetylmuramoyl-L-alanine amidase, partial [Candidatus Peregrinibacteria bacterium]|nr:N-acetylmuramoyl-L-alanine amidase [Candidatus Peregrinibacteria bacterium]